MILFICKWLLNEEQNILDYMYYDVSLVTNIIEKLLYRVRKLLYNVKSSMK